MKATWYATAGTADCNRYYLAWANNSTVSTSTYNIHQTTSASANASSYNIKNSKIYLTGQYEETGATVINISDIWSQRWYSLRAKDYRAHAPHEFRYEHKGKCKSITEKLAPLEEEIELHPEKALRHLRRLLRNPRYRAWQLERINSINRKLGRPEATYDEQKVRATLLKYLTIRIDLKTLKKAQVKAEELLKIFVTPEQAEQLETERRIEIISRNGDTYEILDDGRVNKLLPDGKKQGLCLVAQDGPFPVADIILAKKAMLEACPDKFEDEANKHPAFVLAQH